MRGRTGYRQGMINLCRARASRFDDTALFTALGGGWWNQAETAAEADK